MAQIISITSEALQATIRRLLPSQQGFGEDLQAQNVVVPVIDLTPTAEGSQLPSDLARAIAFGSQTTIAEDGGSTAVQISTAGFYRINAVSTVSQAGSTQSNQISMSNGLSTKVVWNHRIESSGDDAQTSINVDLIVFVAVGDTLSVATAATGAFHGSFRQVADVSGNLVNPSGFTPQ
jgi:hypothetical protein